jgi:MYXO-CTERM domain-containing protein
MEEVRARATLVEPAAGGNLDGFTITMPRGEVEDALATEDADAELVLDVVRGQNGDSERRRVAVALTREDLERMIREAREDRVSFVIAPASLEQAFDSDVEAHGLREAAAAVTIAIVVAGGAGAAQASVDQLGGMAGGSGDSYAMIESARVDTAAPDPYAGVEQIRAERTSPGATTDALAGVEQIRAERTAPQPQGSGITISAPDAAEVAGIAGVAALMIVGAAFAVRRRREPGLV